MRNLLGITTFPTFFYIALVLGMALLQACEVSNHSPFQVSPDLAGNLSLPKPLVQTVRNASRNSRNFSTGTLTTPVGSDDDIIRAATYQDDGKLVVAGRTYDGTFNDFVIARYHPDGSLDQGFSQDGIFTRRFGQGFAWAHAVAVDSNGRVVAVGRAWDETYNFLVMRILSNGTIDTTFDIDGMRAIDFNGGADFGRGVAIQSDDKIVAAGYANNGSNYDFAVARLLTNGNLDPTFGSSGIRTDPIGTADDVANAVHLNPNNGEIILVGYSDSGVSEDFAIIVYATDGTPDTNFSTDGKDTWSLGFSDARAFALDRRPTNDKYLVLGRSRNASNFDFHMVRWNDGNGAQEWEQSQTIGTGADSGHAVAFEGANNRLIAAGRTWNGSNFDFGTMRVDRLDGQVDTDWSSDGKTTNSIGSADDDAYGIAASDGKIIVVGSSHNGSNRDFALARYNSDGNLAASGSHDFSFSSNGERTTNIAGFGDVSFDLTTMSDGRIILGGYGEVGATDSSNRDFAIVRYSTNGVPDVTFHTDGIATMQVGPFRDEMEAVAVQSDEKIVMGGFSEQVNGNTGSRDLVIARFGTDGERDTTFHQDGVFLHDFDSDRERVRDLVIQSDGKIIGAGFRRTGGAATNDFVLIRLQTDGMTDATFSTDGIQTLNVNGDRDEGYAILLQPSDDKILVGGYAENGAAGTRNFVVARFLTEGSRDTTWSGDGIVETNFDSDLDEIRDIAILTDGRVVAVGVAYNDALDTTGDFAIARYLTDGSLDTSFNGTGTRMEDFSSNLDTANCVQIANNGKIVVVGSRRGGSPPQNDHAIARFNTDGSIDTTFDSDGKRFFSTAGTDNGYGCAIYANDGRLILGGQDGGNFGLVRLWP